jgi:mannose-6-phosphate isomerase-like protein (cupin superfamily)
VLYILEGQLTVIDGAKKEATAFAEQALYVSAGEVHMAENRGAGRTRYIAVTAPPPE